MKNKLLLKSPNCADLVLAGQSVEMKKFPDGESYVRIPCDCKGMEVFFLHRCYPEPDTSLIRLFLTLRQLRDMDAARITAVVPYLPYARQDKRFLPGEAMSSEIICSTMKEAGCDRLITFDCHFLKNEGKFVYGGLQITNASMGKAVADYLKNGLEAPLVISPDEGARYLTNGEESRGVMKKIRGEYRKGESVYREIAKLEAKFEVENRDVIIVDDIIAGGSTMIKALRLCLEGGANSVRCGAVHGLFLNETFKRLKNEGASQIACTNSIVGEASKLDISEEIRRLIGL